MKIKNHEADRKDMFALCEKLLVDEKIANDPAEKGEISFVYAVYLDGAKQYPKAIEMLLNAERIAQTLDRPGKSILVTGINLTLATVYGHHKDYENQISRLQYVVENFPDPALPDTKKNYAFAATEMMGWYFRVTKHHNEGVAYLQSIIEKHPNTLTAHTALAQIYDLQMTKHDTTAAAITYSKLQDELRQHPEFAPGSSNTLQLWKAQKEGATIHRHED
ncbi:MAG: hypothetical protein HYR76_09005 [Ignavibacteria bacterium]|nr:hypothetical protein [Ignavibacteria bacterium]MBI3580342.1 hypothetical protein [Ignavibacteriales bacterium]